MKTKPVKVLALDTSSNVTGWALFTNSHYTNSGVINLRHEKELNRRMRLMCLKIMALIKEINPTYVVVEQLNSTRNAHTVRVLSKIIGSAYNYCITTGTNYEEMSCAVWRRIVGIKGRKTEYLKQESVNRVASKYDKCVDDNEADAINLCEAYCSTKLRKKGSKT